VWSVTSWNELRRDGLAADRHNLLHPDAEPHVPFVTQRLQGRLGPVVAVSDYMRAVQDQIRDWVPADFVSLGTDGWGMSDTRGALRRHFLVDAESAEAIERYHLDDPSAAEAGNTEGSG
jgi:pyruvate dehydrogenase E1 component